ncbi:MAG: hypothetical protein D3908_07660, partial [Candidatus Electrothrix sp. AUS4]|nr:hypothetical protein [Candidatus Electrothrix sp. AUS4]
FFLGVSAGTGDSFLLSGLNGLSFDVASLAVYFFSAPSTEATLFCQGEMLYSVSSLLPPNNNPC